jgi:hypothetical protein
MTGKGRFIIPGLAFFFILTLALWHFGDGTSQGPHLDDNPDASKDVKPDNEVQTVRQRLISLGYIGAVEDDPRPNASGVTIYKPEKSYPGYNLFDQASRNEFWLMDMDGGIVHNWSIGGGKKWQYGWLLPNGSILGVDNKRMFQLDWDSNVIWIVGKNFHHDISVSDDGSIYSLTRARRAVGIQGKNITIVDDRIVILDMRGEVIKELSVYDLFSDRIDPERLNLTGMNSGGVFDLFHTNTIEVLNRDTGYAHKGDVIVSLRHMSLIAIIDVGMGRVVWSWGPGELDFQHKPTLLDNDNILIFDNGYSRNYSRIVEVNPGTKRIVWEYKDDERFYSNSRGSVQQLPNGNILVSESNRGRLFEITRGGEIVWEYLNPSHKNDGKRRVLNRVRRYDREYLHDIVTQNS